MKWTFTLIVVSAIALFGISPSAQNISSKDSDVFQVYRNVRITNPDGKKINNITLDDLKVWEDGNEQRPLSFTANTSPLLLEIVLDDSGSMTSQMKHMIDIAKFIVENLEQGTYVQFVRFGNLDRVKLANEWTSDKQLLLKDLDERRGQGANSPVHDGVWIALDQLKQAKQANNNDARAAIVLISDCMEGGSSRNQQELFEELKKSDIPLFVVAMTEALESPNLPVSKTQVDMPMSIIERFAHTSALLSGGSVYLPRKGDNAKLPLAESLKDLVTELRSQYVVTYVPTNQDRNGKERSLRIALADHVSSDKRIVSAKTTYVVPAPIQRTTAR